MKSKVDVYSFGETMRKVVSMEKRTEPTEGKRRKGKETAVTITQKDGRGLVSRYVRDLWNLEEPQMMSLSKLIEDCLNVTPQQRPDMDEVLPRLGELENKLPLH